MSASINEQYDLSVIAGLLAQEESTSSPKIEPLVATNSLPEKVENEYDNKPSATMELESKSPLEAKTISGKEDSNILAPSDSLNPQNASESAVASSSIQTQATESNPENMITPQGGTSTLDSILANHNLQAISDSSDLDETSSEESSEEEKESEEESGSDSDEFSSSDSDSSSSSDSDVPNADAIDTDGPKSDKPTRKHIKNKAKLDALVAESGNDSDSSTGGNKKIDVPATAHEITAPAVALPSITEISAEEPMELVGEVMNVVDSVVVVRSFDHGMSRVLDTGSLLVFEDRKVLGLVFETFGPLTAPLYSIRFPSAAHLPSALASSVSPGSPTSSSTPPQQPLKVYHAPQRSTYAYTSALRLQKGNDASNFYDEEVGEDELEFSDDEKEAEWKRRTGGAKRKRKGSRDGSRTGSVAGDHAEMNTLYGDEEEATIMLSYNDSSDNGALEPPMGPQTSNSNPSRPSVLPSRPSFGGRGSERGSFGRGRGRGRGGEHGKRGGRTRQFNDNARRDGPSSSSSANANYGGSWAPSLPPQSMEYDPTQHPSTYGAMPAPLSNAYPYWGNINQGSFPVQQGGTHGMGMGMGYPVGHPTGGGMGPSGPLPGAHINPHFAMMQMFGGANGGVQNQGSRQWNGYGEGNPPEGVPPR